MMLLFKCRPMSFDNGWTNHNEDCCINTDELLVVWYRPTINAYS